MNSKDMAEIIASREYYANRYNKISGWSVRVKCVKKLKDKVTATVILQDDENGESHTYTNCEYPLDMFVKKEKV